MVNSGCYHVRVAADQIWKRGTYRYSSYFINS